MSADDGNKAYKTGVINDPFGQTHSLASSEHCFRFNFVLFCEKWGRTDGRTNGRHMRKQWSLTAVTVGRHRGSIIITTIFSSIFCLIFLVIVTETAQKRQKARIHFKFSILNPLGPLTMFKLKKVTFTFLIFNSRSRPQSRPVIITIFTHVRPFQNCNIKRKSLPAFDCGLAEWIIDDPYLVQIIFKHNIRVWFRIRIILGVVAISVFSHNPLFKVTILDNVG